MPNPPDDFLDCFDADNPSFGTRLLRRFVKHSATVDEGELTRYRLESDLKLNGTHFGRRFASCYFDATYNLCLTYEEQLIASLGFEVDGDGITIWQLQGRRGASAPLRPIKWERALVRAAVDWATARGLREVAMASVDNLEWAALHGHLDPARGRMLYDVTARRSGFKRDEDGYWVRRLN